MLFRSVSNKSIVYYKELGEPAHATALDYLANKYDWDKHTMPQKPIRKSIFNSQDFVPYVESGRAITSNIEVKTMPVFTLKGVKDNTYNLYVFGDNMVKRGKGGQAIIRDEANAFGIPTKNLPNTTKESYFTDAKYEEATQAIEKAIVKIRDDGRTIIFPRDGIGTGLAKLKEKAPRVYAYLNLRLLQEFGFNNVTGKVISHDNLSALRKRKKLPSVIKPTSQTNMEFDTPTRSLNLENITWNSRLGIYMVEGQAFPSTVSKEDFMAVGFTLDQAKDIGMKLCKLL